jgi:dGTPase
VADVSSRLFRDHSTLEADEARRLAPYATRSVEATRRMGSDQEQAADYRLAFQRDRDRILHSRAFRRLKHKTQVLVPHVADHPRTRLTHTLEVGQLGRTIARALGLNEDLVEAVAMGHDVGHTAFGHTGETALAEILSGQGRDFALPEEVVKEVGGFKHNYQSVRVVDLLEWRYEAPGLNLTDQVREGILKHTTWKVRFSFPLPDPEGLFPDQPSHLEGQALAAADEIAQQTHDLEDGLRAGSVDLQAVEELGVSRRVIDRFGDLYRSEDRRWRRQSLLIRGVTHLFVSDVISAGAARLERFLERRGISDHQGFTERSREISQTTVWFSDEVEELFDELKTFIYRFIINHSRVNRQDWRARKVVSALYRAYWLNPLNLPSYVLLRARDELGYPYLRDLPLRSVADEVAARYHSSPGYARLVADHIAGMSDRFALEEYRSLEQPTPEQTFHGDER